MTIQDKSKRFAELVGICLGENLNDEGICLNCGLSIEAHKLPDFSDAREVWRVVKKINKFKEFLSYLFDKEYPPDRFEGVIMSGETVLEWIEMFSNTTGLLLDEAIEFLEGV